MLCLFKIWPMQCAFVMMADTLADSYLLLWLVGMQWLSGRGLYVNELMAKKLSLLGCVAMMIATHNQVLNGRSLRAFLFPAHLPVLCPQANERSSSSFLSRGLLEVSALSNNISIAVLIGRLLIAVLFVYVGLHELHRLFFEVCRRWCVLMKADMALSTCSPSLLTFLAMGTMLYGRRQ
uniref:Uncharacterized protein n=1 Tax=Prymnesium polylepis TaxID=72548 RepID=A0A6T8AGI4_9EUKA|mmetsp:Transcript_32817/g.81625  ORF Transcript_32817/g.81625 Transcript_32817/m.81625 type:complete len:179 (+) Transcript_32817:1041-1577(+)